MVLLSGKRFTPFVHGKTNLHVGGQISVLLNKVKTMPDHMEGSGFSNHIVGIISPPPLNVTYTQRAPTTHSAEQQYVKGVGLDGAKAAGMSHNEAVNRLKEISFHSKAAKHQKRDNIKFII
jgi:hypothetical protein